MKTLYLLRGVSGCGRVRRGRARVGAAGGVGRSRCARVGAATAV